MAEVYKYVVPERIDVLLRERIRYTQASALNDPFELHPFFEAIAPDREVFSYLETMDLTPKLIEAYLEQPNEVRSNVSEEQFLATARELLSTSEGKQALQEACKVAVQALRELTPSLRDEVSKGLRAHIGILSVSAVPDNVLMWSHYADHHRGFAIGLDQNHPSLDGRRSADDEFRHFRAVEYRPPRGGLALNELSGTDVLIRKSPEWAYEQELRSLARLSDAAETLNTGNEPIHLFPLAPKAVVELVLGARSSDILGKALDELLVEDPRYGHVRLRRVALNESSGSLEIHDVALQSGGT